MEALQHILKTQGTNVTNIDLEFKSIENLEDLLPQLANFSNLKELNLHGNRLAYLPDDLSLLDTVEVLDISNNIFSDVNTFHKLFQLGQVVDALSTMPNLIHLEITIQSKEEEQFILECLSNLQILNSQKVNGEQEGADETQEQQSEQQSDRSMSAVQDITLQQYDLEQMAILYDSIREYKQENQEDKQFDHQIRAIMLELQQKLKQNNPDHLTNLYILTAKFNLYEICFKSIIKHFKANDKSLDVIITKIHDMHLSIFNDLFNVIQNVKPQSKNTSQIVDNKKQVNQPQQGDKAVENRLRLELSELQQQNAELEKENKRYLDLLIKHSKGDKSSIPNSEHVIKQQSDSYQSQNYTKNHQSSSQQNNVIFQSKQSQNLNSVPQQINVRHLTLKQLKDVIQEIYESKQKFDQKCAESKLPRETMEQHMYTFLNQKYGLKSLIIEWATSIVNALKKYSAEDNDVAVFGKILRNECDEEFRFVQTQVKNTMQELLKMYLRGKFPLKHQAEIKEMLNQRINGQLYEEEAVDIIKYMYNQEDSELLLNKLKQYYIVPHKNPDRRLTREEQLSLLQEKDKYKLEYSVFQKIILDFQLKSHEKYLKKFIMTFKQMDTDANGIIDENEFRNLIDVLNFGAGDLDIEKYLNIIDPYSHQQITFSQCVTLFSSESVPGSNGQIQILQKISEQ
ncbi:unnamed protein product (macronuclear) [Paramecium tetraurelia]|uniref:EF-hand domain-containing protein n=1 Tax=Paramecium tetraurelia TaxID=5888 RepID=A0E060_PARTE|nr:uncharacterized protein GSPATT00021845001 [Paramecium tetraurelia]CAK88677.1 unnamed protein product [Paramecium tetraurelia]|eukprot:XP_001456074.1 hypothetical protein (macronuclear) [Paramecium tetraurelia strain d4-2]